MYSTCTFCYSLTGQIYVDQQVDIRIRAFGVLILFTLLFKPQPTTKTSIDEPIPASAPA